MGKKIGVVSDTHGLLRQSLAEILTECDLVIHAGDLDNQETLERFMQLGPEVRIARGNCDYGAWAESLAPFEFFEFGGYTFYVRHIPWAIDIDPAAAGVDIVITGHTHRVESRSENGVFYINPGSAGPSATGRSATSAILHIDENGMSHEFVEL